VHLQQYILKVLWAWYIFLNPPCFWMRISKQSTVEIPAEIPEQAKTLPWGRTCQCWPVLAKWCFQPPAQSVYGDTDKSKPFPIVLQWIMIQGTETLIWFFFWRKVVFKNGFTLWKYKQKPWNQRKCQLEAERTSAVFVFSKLRFEWRVSGHFSVDSDQNVYFLPLHIDNLCVFSAVSPMCNVELCEVL